MATLNRSLRDETTAKVLRTVQHWRIMAKGDELPTVKLHTEKRTATDFEVE